MGLKTSDKFDYLNRVCWDVYTFTCGSAICLVLIQIA